jgi:hypothetical protein
MTVLDGGVDESPRTTLERKKVVVENAMHAVDDLLSELSRSRRGLTCWLHRAERLPTLCPLCALVETRQRMKGHPEYRSAI